MNHTIERVTTKEQLDNLYNHSALTIEGLAEQSIPDFLRWLADNTTFTKENPTVYITSGKVMNDFYSLTGSNAYKDDLSLVSIIDIDITKIILTRFAIGGRWFDDIVDNNERRQKEGDIIKYQSISIDNTLIECYNI